MGIWQRIEQSNISVLRLARLSGVDAQRIYRCAALTLTEIEAIDQVLADERAGKIDVGARGRRSTLVAAGSAQ